MQTETPPTGVRSRLYREPEEKKIAGVCGGLADHFGLDPRLVRLATIVLALINGIGLVAYLVAVVVLPARPPEVPRQPKAVEPLSTSTSNALVIGLILVAAVMAGDIDLWWFDGATLGILLVAVGLWLLVADRENSSNSTTRGARRTTLQGEAASQSDPSGADDHRTTPHRLDSDDSAGPRGEVPPPVPPWGPPSMPAGPATAPGVLLTDPEHPLPAVSPKPAQSAFLPAMVAGILLLCVGISALVQVLDVFHPSAIEQVGALLVILGVGMLVGAWRGRARALAGIGLPVICVVVVGEAIDFPMSADAGDREIVVSSLAELRALDAEHELLAGQLVVDLSDAPLSEASGALRTIDLTADVGFGELEVILPSDVIADVDADVDIGELRWDRPGESGVNTESGVNVKRDLRFDGRPDGGRIRLDVHVGIGELDIRQEGGVSRG